MIAHWVVLAAAALTILVAATVAAALTVFTGQALPSRIAAAMPGIPFSFHEAFWSDPLGLVPGALPASPASAGRGNTALLQAAAMSGIESHAALVAGQWPTAPGGSHRQPIPAADPGRLARLGGGAASCLPGRRAAAARPDH